LANYRASDGHFVSSARPSLRSGVRPAAAAIFLVVTVEAGAEDDVRGLLADVAGLTRSVGFRRPDSDLSCVVGVGSALWDRLFVGPRPSGLHPFVELHGARHTAVATPGDLLFHLRARRLDVCFELARLLANRLAGHAHIVDEVHGFKYFDERDLMGFVDGTENPTGVAAISAAIVGDEDPDFAGGSYVIVQKVSARPDPLGDLAGRGAAAGGGKNEVGRRGVG